MTCSFKEVSRMLTEMSNELYNENKTEKEVIKECVDEWFNNLPEDNTFKKAIIEIENLNRKEQ